MKTQIIRKIIDQYRGVIYYIAGLVAYLWLIISMFPSVEKIDFNAMIEQMPDYMQGFYTSGGLKDVSTIEGFLSGEILSFFLILILSFYVAGSAASTIAGAIEKRTLDFTLSQPISRIKYFLSDFLVTFGFMSLATGITLLSIKPLCFAYDISISSSGLFKLWFIVMMMLLSIYGLSILFSSIFKSRSGVISITVGLTFGFYMLTTLAAALDKLKDFEIYSLYHYYKPYEVMTGQAIEFRDILVLAGVFLLGTTLSIIVFNKKDI